MPTNDPRPTKAQRRDDARMKAVEMRAAQQKREKRQRLIAIGGLVAALVALAVIVVVILSRGDSTDSTADAAYTGDPISVSDVVKPSTAAENGAIPVGPDGVAGVQPSEGDVTVSVYLDYMCPYCGEFEKTNAEDLAELTDAGGVIVEYYPVSILDRYSSGTAYSTRASNAAAVVANSAPEQWSDFNAGLFASQPAENTEGLSDEQIATIALDAGVPQEVVDEFTATAPDEKYRTFAPYVAALTDQASADFEASGGFSTPTVLINGEKFTGNFLQAGELANAITAATTS